MPITAKKLKWNNSEEVSVKYAEKDTKGVDIDMASTVKSVCSNTPDSNGNVNLDADDVGALPDDTTYVSYTSQTLSSANKIQGRKNIGLVSCTEAYNDYEDFLDAPGSYLLGWEYYNGSNYGDCYYLGAPPGDRDPKVGGYYALSIGDSGFMVDQCEDSNINNYAFPLFQVNGTSLKYYTADSGSASSTIAFEVDGTSARYKGTALATTGDLNNYVSKYTSSSSSGVVYGVSVSASQTTYNLSRSDGSIMGANEIPVRGTNGHIFVPETPTNSKHAASKNYVDAKQNKLYLHELKITFGDEDHNTVSLITSVILATSSDVTTEDFYNQDAASYIRLITQIRSSIAFSYEGVYKESYVIREIDCQNDHTLNIEYKSTMDNASGWCYGYDGSISDIVTSLG